MIISTIDQFTTAVPTAAGMDSFDDLQTYSESAERWLRDTILGTTLYTDITDAIDTSTSTDDDTELLTLCRNIIANHAYYNAVPFLDLQHTEAGFGVIQSTNKAPASAQRIERLRAQCIARRDDEIEALLRYLETHTEYHDAWKGSEEFSTIYNSLLPTLEIFRRYHHIVNRETLQKMYNSIITVQSTLVARVISQDYVDELIESQKDADFSTADNAILPTLRHAICLLALSDSIHDMAVVIDANGTVRSANQNVNNYAAETRLESYSRHFRKRGNEMLDKVLGIMVSNIANYETFADSSEYEAITASSFENDEDYEIFSSIM